MALRIFLYVRVIAWAGHIQSLWLYLWGVIRAGFHWLFENVSTKLGEQHFSKEELLVEFFPLTCSWGFSFIYSNVDNSHLPASSPSCTFTCHAAINSESNHWYSFKCILQPWTTTDHHYHCKCMPVMMTMTPLIFIQVCTIITDA